MKKNLITIMCCVLFVSNFAACSKEQETEVSLSSNVIANVESTSAITSESESSTESNAKNTISETTENAQNSETNEEDIEEEKEQINYRIELTNSGDNKVLLIKTYRRLSNLELKEAKDMVDSAPCILFETTNKEEADYYKTALEGSGATVTIYEETLDEQTVEDSTQIYYVKLLTIGDNIEAVTETITNITDLGLLPVTSLLESVPCLIYQTTDLEKANSLINALTDVGATVDNNITDSKISDGSEQITNEQTVNEETKDNIFAVNKVFNITDAGTVITGKVENGTIKLGDKAVIVLEDGTEIPVTINRIEIFGGFLEVAEKGKDVSLGFEEAIEKETVLTAVSIVVKAE